MSILIKNLSHCYNANTQEARVALEDINLSIERGQFIGLVGHTGSGKSTLIQICSGLLKPSQGEVAIDGVNIYGKGKEIRQKKMEVGLVFQYPEYQLFEETVAKDIAFGPKNQGLNEEDQIARVKEAMALVDLDYETYKEKSPFYLSGGQKRRVAIAGILAMKPSYLILDEPTAGLDPAGREQILSVVRSLQQETGITVILVSHNMDDVARFADRLLVMSQGRILHQGRPNEVFKEYSSLKSVGLGVPYILELVAQLRAKGFVIPEEVDSFDRVLKFLDQWLKERKKP